jgi:hypothetical protein
MEFIKNPVHAAIGITVYLVWFMTSNVSTAQSRIEEKLSQNAALLTAIVKADAENLQTERQRTALIRQICIGVNKGSDKEKCG